MNEHTLKDLFGIERKYFYELKTLTKKNGKFLSEYKAVIFNTITDDDLRYIEDIAEEVCKKHHLPFKNTVFYEVNDKNKWWRIDMIWEPSRFRNTCFIELETSPFKEKEEALT
jgi:hypothetical protein